MRFDSDETKQKSRLENIELRRRNRLLAGLILSLLIHVLFAGGLTFGPVQFSKPTRQTTVELVSPEELLQKLNADNSSMKNQQIVDAGEQRLNDVVDKDAKYLSRYDQKVLRETRAAQNGAFKNSAGTGPRGGSGKVKVPSPAQTAPDQKAPDVASESSTGEELQDDYGDIASLRPKKKANKDLAKESTQRPKTDETTKSQVAQFVPNFRKLPESDSQSSAPGSGNGQEASATDDSLKDVETGMQTMLSTREFVYFSYYNRIKEKLRQHWQPKLREKFTRMLRSGRQIASDGNDKITKVIIILDETGTLVRVQVLDHSGLIELDEAAVDAFRAAAPFPNPPAGIVDPDGTVKIRWDFVVEA